MKIKEDVEISRPKKACEQGWEANIGLPYNTT